MAESISRAFIDDVLARVDIVDLIEQRLPLKKRGNEFIACCPFHKEKTPSFYVSPHKQIFKCFGCGKGGDIIKFLCEHDHMTFIEALTLLANQAGVAIPNTLTKENTSTASSNELYQLMKQISQYYYQQFCQTPYAIDYIKNRGLSGEIVKNYQIGYAPQGWDNIIKQFGHNQNAMQQLEQCGLIIYKDQHKCYDRFRHRIMFPIHDRQGNVIGFGGRVLDHSEPKYLNSPETIIFHKGNELYGLYYALKNQKLDAIIIVEGYMDVLALAQYGITNVVATLGTATTKQHLQRLYRYTHNLIFCFDGDNAGRNAAWRACQTLLPLIQDNRQAKFMFLPEKDDPDSYIRQHGTESFLTQLQQATPLSHFLFEHTRQNINLTSIDERSQYISQVMPLIEQITEGTFKQLLLEKLAQITHVNIETLQHNQAAHKTSAATTTTTNHQSEHYSRLSPVRLAIALLLQNPLLIHKIDKKFDLTQIHLAGIDVLLDLINAIKQNPKSTTAMLLHHWHETKFSSLMSNLAMWPLLIPEQGLAEELNHTLQRLETLHQEKTIETLLQKASIATLSEQDKSLLQRLIKQSKSKFPTKLDK